MQSTLPFLILGVEPDIESISGLCVIKSMERECQKTGEKIHEAERYPSLFNCFFAALSLFPNLSTS